MPLSLLTITPAHFHFYPSCFESCLSQFIGDLIGAEHYVDITPRFLIFQISCPLLKVPLFFSALSASLR